MIVLTEIDIELINVNDNDLTYDLIIDGNSVGNIYAKITDDEATINYDFNPFLFRGIKGTILLNEILIKVLYYNDKLKKSSLRISGSSTLYSDAFDINTKKEINDGGITYFKKR